MNPILESPVDPKALRYSTPVDSFPNISTPEERDFIQLPNGNIERITVVGNIQYRTGVDISTVPAAYLRQYHQQDEAWRIFEVQYHLESPRIQYVTHLYAQGKQKFSILQDPASGSFHIFASNIRTDPSLVTLNGRRFLQIGPSSVANYYSTGQPYTLPHTDVSVRYIEDAGDPYIQLETQINPKDESTHVEYCLPAHMPELPEIQTQLGVILRSEDRYHYDPRTVWDHCAAHINFGSPV